eukprot:COSAG02_NODE_1275_length_13506_cov_8.845603_3_plen_165_part_00
MLDTGVLRGERGQMQNEGRSSHRSGCWSSHIASTQYFPLPTNRLRCACISNDRPQRVAPKIHGRPRDRNGARATEQRGGARDGESAAPMRLRERRCCRPIAARQIAYASTCAWRDRRVSRMSSPRSRRRATLGAAGGALEARGSSEALVVENAQADLHLEHWAR